jgi:hypothetical protein
VRELARPQDFNSRNRARFDDDMEHFGGTTPLKWSPELTVLRSVATAPRMLRWPSFRVRDEKMV